MALPDDSRRRILTLMERHGIVAFAYQDRECTMSLSRDRALHVLVRAPQAGRFYVQHPAGSGANIFPRPVRAGERVAFLKVGGLILPVHASDDGVLEAPRLKDGALVGFGDILF